MRLLASLPPLLCSLLPTIGLVPRLSSWCKASKNLPSPLLLALLRGHSGRKLLESCIGNSSSTSRRDCAGGRGAALPAAACLHHSAFHASLGVQCVGDHAHVGMVTVRTPLAATACCCLLVPLFRRGGEDLLCLCLYHVRGSCGQCVCGVRRREGGEGGREGGEGGKGRPGYTSHSKSLLSAPSSLGASASLDPHPFHPCQPHTSLT